MPEVSTVEKIRIALADDDEDDRLIFSEALEGSKVNAILETFHDGYELMMHLNNADSELPNLIFLDLNMPKKTGMECLSAIRTDQRLCDISVVIYSTSSNQEEIDEAFKKGATMYVKKTSHFEKLKDIISDVLNPRRHSHTSDLGRENFLIFQ